MFSLGAFQPMALERHLVEQSTQPLTYRDVGLTQASQKPDGFVLDEHQVILGAGREVFERARTELQRWRAHRLDWMRLYPANPSVAVGSTVLLIVRLGVLEILAACRVVYVNNEARTFGFGYGTLPMHPECGEERFLLEWLEDDRVRFSLFAFSKPSNWFYQLGQPVTRWMQFRGSRAYLNAMLKAAKANVPLE